MRILAICFAMLATPAMALFASGPPWLCKPVAVCDPNDNCVGMPAAPISFYLKGQRGPDSFIAEGLHGRSQQARRFQTLNEVRKTLANDETREDFSIVLVPYPQVADAYGFWLYDVSINSQTLKRSIAATKMMIVCNGIPQ